MPATSAVDDTQSFVCDTSRRHPPHSPEHWPDVV